MRTVIIAARLILTGRWRLVRHAKWIADYEAGHARLG